MSSNVTAFQKKLQELIAERKEALAKTFDGFTRTPEVEDRINEKMRMVLDSEQGREVMAYLRSITTNHVLGPDVTDAHLRHMEGMRHLVALIERRIAAAKRS